MGTLNKNLPLLFVAVLAASSLIMVECVGAQSSTSYPVVIITPTPTPPPSFTPPPTPSPSPTPMKNVGLTYSEVNRWTTNEGKDTTIVLDVKAQYNFGGSVTLNYQNLVLGIIVQYIRGLEPTPFTDISSDVRPIEKGTVTINSTNTEADFQLTYMFPTRQPLAYVSDGTAEFSSYQLTYTGDIAISTAPPQSTSIPTQNPVLTANPTPVGSGFQLDQTSLVAIGLGIAEIILVVVVLLVYLKKIKNKPGGEGKN
jgi:hypothetical protein